MNTKHKNILVLAFNEDSVVAVQASLGHGCYEIKRTATLSMDETTSWDDPDGFGHSLRQFLRKEHLSARATLVGVPARWVVAKSVQIPPTRPENVASLLQIQTEQAFSMSHQDLTFDYSAQISDSLPNQVLLAAMKRHRLDQIKILAKAAGLHLLSVTPSVAAMGALSDGLSRACGIHAQNEHCEMVLASGGVIHQIKHMSTPLNNKDPQVMAQDIQRLLLLSGSQIRELVVWSGGSTCPDTMTHLRQILDSKIEVQEGRDALTQSGRLRVGDASTEYDGAMSLLLAHTQAETPLIDFLNSHLVVKESRQKSRAVLWGAVSALAAVVLMAGMLFGWYQDAHDVEAYQETLEENARLYEAASAIRLNLSNTSPWYTKRPQFLDGLNELVTAFPEAGDIWVSSLRLTDNGEGLITGEAVNRLAVIKVLDQLNQSDRISDATSPGSTGGTYGSGEAKYSIRFDFKSE
ncbi:MAG: pilus assembly protein PilM [Planctomycetes bacterium]|nr:pilus assembly protein PilM [Planctomycetota bacterium]